MPVPYAAVRDRGLDGLGVVAVAAILVGIRMLDGTGIGSTWEGAWDGVASQLPVTLPAALIVLGTTAVQLAAGSVVVRAMRGRPYRSVIDALLGALVGAVTIGLVALMLLGSLGWFRVPALLLLNGVIIGLGWFVRPFFADPPRLRLGWPTVAGALVVLAWSGAVILQLASPVVPFIDVLPNHVAPAEHLRDVRRVRGADHGPLSDLRPVTDVPGLHRAARLGHGPERAARGVGRLRVHPSGHRAGRSGHGPPGIGHPWRRRGLVDAASPSP